MAYNVLTDAQVAILQDLVNQARQLVRSSKALPTGDFEVQAPDTYVARTPLGGIPPRDGIYPGTAECEIYHQIDDGSRRRLEQIEGLVKIVCNLSTTAIDAYSWVFIARDKGGDWYTIGLPYGDGGSDETGTGTGTDGEELPPPNIPGVDLDDVEIVTDPLYVIGEKDGHLVKVEVAECTPTTAETGTGTGTTSTGSGGVSDHGELTGLEDDDHLQYHNDVRGDLRYQPLDTELTALAGLASAANKLPRFTGAGTADLLDFSTDGTFAANSDTKIPSEKAIKTYVASVAGATDHGALTGLSDDDHSIYALLAGRSGGQSLIGGTASGDQLLLQSTSHATKGGMRVANNDWIVLPAITGTLPGTLAGGVMALYGDWDGARPHLLYKDETGNTFSLSAITPVGGLLFYAGTGTPVGRWLLCDGSSFSSATYADLYAVIGTTYGAGPNLPNFQRRVPMGSGGTGTATIGNAVGNTGGAETHTLSTGEMPSHNHSVWSGEQYAEVAAGAGTGIVGWKSGGTVTGPYVTSNTGGGGAHNNIQPSLVVKVYIRY